jgi:predicted molibdopterin-dependent oxidoreductase YjgC
MEEGKIKVAYLMGENPLLSDPDTRHIKAAIEKLDFFVVQDIFLTETAQMADVVLPAASFAEKEGTFSNTERRVQRVRKAFDPPGVALADWEIICEIARRMDGKGFDFKDAEAIFKEIARLTPSYAGISYERLDNEGGIQWPCPDDEHPGTQYLHKGSFVRGKGRFAPLTYRPSDEQPDSEYPLILTTGRSPYHYHTATMTRKVAGLNALGPEELIWISPADAEKLGVTTQDWVEVSSRRGTVPVRAKVTEDTQPGVVFMTFHYAEACANVLTNPALDPVCKTPEFKVCAVKVEKRRESEPEQAEHLAQEALSA